MPKATTRPPVDEGEFTFVLSADEVLAIVQILAFSKDVFAKMSANSEKDGDINAAKTYATRSELSGLLYEKFRENASIGEPTSRNLH